MAAKMMHNSSLHDKQVTPPLSGPQFPKNYYAHGWFGNIGPTAIYSSSFKFTAHDSSLRLPA
jgi:hypothetical protein